MLLPDLQGNVAASSDDVSWVIILYNLGFLCSIAVSYWMTRVLGARRHLFLSIALYAGGAFKALSACSGGLDFAVVLAELLRSAQKPS